jgi:hypothetical protein
MSTIATHPLERPSPEFQPDDSYRQMAQVYLSAAPAVRDFLSRCAACGLPVEDRQQKHEEICKFCSDYLANFFGHVP